MSSSLLSGSEAAEGSQAEQHRGVLCLKTFLKSPKSHLYFLKDIFFNFQLEKFTS